MMTVAPGFFDTMEIPLLAPTRLRASRRRGRARVAVINAAAATELFGTDDAVGRRFGFQPEERGEIEVVGVVRDTRYDDLRGAAPPTVFRSAVLVLPLRSATLFVLVRNGPARTPVTPMRCAMVAIRHSFEPRLIVNVRTAAIEERMS